MERRRFVALGTSLAATALAGCFGPTSGPGGDESDLETGDPGIRDVTNELRDVLTVSQEALLEENGRLTFSVRLENISQESVTADLAATMLDGDGDAVSEEYVERNVTVEAGTERLVTFDVDEGPSDVASYRLVVTAAEDPEADDNEGDDSEDVDDEDTDSGDGERESTSPGA